MKIAEIIRRLKEPVDPRLISQKKVGGNVIDFISWYKYCDLLDERCGLSNWSWEVLSMTVTDERIFITGKLTIYGDDRSLCQMATGTEILNCNSYGDPSSNAEAMALRRACAKFSLARQLWEKKENNFNQNKRMSKKEVTREEWLKIRRNQQN